LVILKAFNVGADSRGGGAGTEAGCPEALTLSFVAEDEVNAEGNGNGIDA
jgi:hypothetical protein